ncbi:MafI family immunity protein [Cellulomonas massiliensis]|uniref:MafI family immunity protein n=1 Tax=Cellulomonas massiliensis TaxID=1465811 RepID=UPI000372A83B|nr:MafI family immunity protein [Cellulomonas massiliensis]
MDAVDLRGRLLGALIRLEDRLPADQVTFVHEYVDAGEWVLALEQLADVLSEDEIGLPDDERAELLALNDAMGLGGRVADALEACPSVR